VGRHATDVLIVKVDFALVRGMKTGQEAQESGLATAAGTEQKKELVVVDLQGNVLQDRTGTEILGEILQTYFHRNQA
jgi:hypothetical protein